MSVSFNSKQNKKNQRRILALIYYLKKLFKHQFIASIGSNVYSESWAFLMIYYAFYFILVTLMESNALTTNSGKLDLAWFSLKL